jgi:hypothetical protein
MKTQTRSKHLYIINGAIASVVLAASLAMPVAAMAEDGSQSISRERLLHKFDINGDGVLNDREKYHARKTLARLHQRDNDRRPDRRMPRRVQRPATNR